MALSDETIVVLNKLQYRADAARQVCQIPLASIYWSDEMPDVREMMALSEESLNSIWRLFGIRFMIWDQEKLASEEASFWDAARSEVPDWALFKRLALSPQDQQARLEVEEQVAAEWEEVFGKADRLELQDIGNGLHEFKATFDLTKTSPAEANSALIPAAGVRTKFRWSRWLKFFQRVR